MTKANDIEMVRLGGMTSAEQEQYEKTTLRLTRKSRL